MLKERHLFTLYHLTIYLGNRFWGSGMSLYRAFSRLVGTVTNGALLVPPLLGALGHNMSYCLAPIAFGNMAVWVCIMEDGHFNRSSSARWELDSSPNNPRCFNKGRLDQTVARSYRDWVD